jgi:hypothetical protein
VVGGASGHVDGVGDEFGAPVVRDRPAHHPSAPRVDHDRQVDPSLAGAVLGDVLHPQPIRAVGTELAMHQIIGTLIGGPRARAAHDPSAGDAL